MLEPQRMEPSGRRTGLFFTGPTKPSGMVAGADQVAPSSVDVWRERGAFEDELGFHEAGLSGEAGGERWDGDEGEEQVAPEFVGQPLRLPWQAERLPYNFMANQSIAEKEREFHFVRGLRR